MAFIGDLDLDSVPDRTFEPIPDGWYVAQIKSAEVKPTSDGTGKRLNVRFDILGPTHAGAVIFQGLNIRNKNAEAERIALQELKAIRNAGGLPALQDTDQLIGMTMEVKVATQPAKDGFEARNQLKGYRAPSGGAAPAPAAPRAAAPGPVANKAPPPWATKKATAPAAPVAPAPVAESDTGEQEIF